MDSQELRNLSEAYLEVYQQVDEAQYTAPPQAQQPPAEVRKAPKKAPKKAPNPATRLGTALAAAYLGKELGKELLKKKPPVRGVFEEVDIYDIILSHLLDEGYAETIEGAEVIMVNMSEEWRDSIVDEMLDEAYVDWRKGKLTGGKSPQQRSQLRANLLDARRRRSLENTSGLSDNDNRRLRNQKRVSKEMDSHTSLSGKIGKALSPGLSNRPGASPRIAYGEPNTSRHQQGIARRTGKYHGSPVPKGTFGAPSPKPQNG